MDSNTSFIACIEQSVKENWNRNAFTDYKGETLRYSDVARRIAKLHTGMHELGLQPGDRVAVCGRNSSNWAVAYFSIITYGCVVVPIQCEFQPEQIHNIVNHSEAKFLYLGDGVTGSIDFDAMPQLMGIGNLQDLSIRNERQPRLLYIREHLNELFGKQYPNRFTKDDVNYRRETSGEELAMLNYTSGTTGFSKGVMIPYRSLWGNYDFTRQCLQRGIPQNVNILSTLPMAHTFGMTCEVIFGFLCGHHVTFLCRQPSPTIIMQACQEVKPALLICVPLVLEKIVRKHVYERLDRYRFRYLLQFPLIKSQIKERTVRWMIDQLGGNIYQVFTGGAPMNAEIEKFLMSFGFPITSGYGATETSPMITFSDWHDHAFGSCGTAVPHMELRIDGDDPEGKGGELLVRGMHVMLGYYKNPEATAEVLDADGWFHTGDLCTLSADGHLYIKGRIKNMLLGSNGQNVYPEEIEDKLNSMPMVSESLVIQSGEKLIALVYPDQEEVSVIPVNEDDIKLLMEQNRQQLNTMLPAYSRISEIRLHPEEFQKTAKKSIKRYLYKA